jgi:hypothetical protein
MCPAPPQVANGYRPPLPPHLPAPVAAVITACWKNDPELRPAARAVVEALERVQESGGATAAVDGLVSSWLCPAIAGRPCACSRSNPYPSAPCVGDLDGSAADTPIQGCTCSIM